MSQGILAQCGICDTNDCFSYFCALFHICCSASILHKMYWKYMQYIFFINHKSVPEWTFINELIEQFSPSLYRSTYLTSSIRH